MKKSYLLVTFLLIISVLASCKYYNSYYTGSNSEGSQSAEDSGINRPQIADDGDTSLKIEGINLSLNLNDRGKWEIALGDRYNFYLYIDLVPLKASLRNLEFKTSDESVAYFDEDNNFITLKEGECKITLKSKNSDKKITQDVIVMNKSIDFSSDNCFGISALKRWNGIVEYSLDARRWYEWYGETIKSKLSQKDEKYHVYFRGKGNDAGTNYSKFSIISLDGTVDYKDLRVRCDGDLTNLVNYRGLGPVVGDCNFSGLFSDCEPLESAPSLSGFWTDKNKVHVKCGSMFSGCTSLITAPELPQTSFSAAYGDIGEAPYSSMFSGCTSLTTAPELPAMQLAPWCYDSMFKDCTSLTSAPVLPATELSDGCYHFMFEGCTSLTTAPELPAMQLGPSCYSSMFKDCKSLVSASALPAETLARGCYYNMFEGCNSLNEIPSLSHVKVTNDDVSYIFSGCELVKFSESQHDEYQNSYVVFGPDVDIVYAYGLFAGTAGEFTSDPEARKTYYTPNKIISPKNNQGDNI